MVLCPGCGGSFALGAGYVNHIRLSRNADCAAIYQQSLLYQYNTDSDYDNDNQEDQHADIEDYFVEGDGDDMDYEWSVQDIAAEQGNENEGWEEKIDNSALEMDEIEPEEYYESDSDEDEFGGEFEECWEPPPQAYPSEMNFEDELDDDLGLSREARLAAEDAFRKSPVIEKYPDSRAGAPVSHDRIASRNESYAQAVNNVHNPWAPFLSQMDWEVAQWAKLRGPGSTAMSDLLKVDGVSI